jgi:hypothetical protein
MSEQMGSSEVLLTFKAMESLIVHFADKSSVFFFFGEYSPATVTLKTLYASIFFSSCMLF